MRFISCGACRSGSERRGAEWRGAGWCYEQRGSEYAIYFRIGLSDIGSGGGEGLERRRDGIGEGWGGTG